MPIHDIQHLVADAQLRPAAFGVIFDRYYVKIMRYCTQRTGSVMLAEDITSETFIKAYHNIANFKGGDENLSAWLYKIATNEIRMHYRARKNHHFSLEELCEDGFEIAGATDVHEEAVAAESKCKAHEDFTYAIGLITGLPMKYQEVIVLRYIQNKKISDIAVITGRKEGTVKSLLSRGLKKLRLQMQPNNSRSIIYCEEISKKAKDTIYEAQ